MGYFKDNFPGSAAQLQRSRVAKGVVAYSLLVGSAIYFFSPFSRSLKEEILKGSWDDPEWVKKQKYLMREGFVKVVPYATREQIDEALAEQDDNLRQDFVGPNLHKKTQEYLRTPSPPANETASEAESKK